MATMQTNTEHLDKHCIHMEQEVWQLAQSTAKSLGLSTSQFISRLVEETDGVIQPGGLLGIQKKEAIH